MGASSLDHKQHFEFLDGLRGVAALLVGMLHASQAFDSGYSPNHAALAVDFFFCLSGFVIAYAYDDKLGQGMGYGDFVLKRLIRLYPMILCGIVLGGAVAFVGNHHGPVLTLALTAASLALLPAGLLVHQQAYPMNNPIWSLFFELAANAVYGVERCVLRIKTVLVAVLILLGSGFALVAVAWNYGGLEDIGFLDVSGFLAGFVRVAFPFFAGVFIYRYGLFRLRFSTPSLALAAALIAVLAAPVFQGAWIYDVVAVIGIFPAIVILGANAARSHWLSGLWALLGKLSYPFYIIHQPVLRAISNAPRLLHLPGAVIVALPALAILTAAGGAYLVMKLYDEPVRFWLTRRRGSSRRTPEAPPAHPILGNAD